MLDCSSFAPKAFECFEGKDRAHFSDLCSGSLGALKRKLFCGFVRKKGLKPLFKDASPKILSGKTRKEFDYFRLLCDIALPEGASRPVRDNPSLTGSL